MLEQPPIGRVLACLWSPVRCRKPWYLALDRLGGCADGGVVASLHEIADLLADVRLAGTVAPEGRGQDFAAAEALIDQIDKDIGYGEEAQRLRAMVAKSREATIEERLEAAIKRIEKLIGNLDWARALRETKRLTTLFPEDARVGKLAQAIHAARNRRKRDLLQAYGDAARKNDVERSIELLKELDGYLAPPEGAALAESARGVFKARLSNLGVQFAIHVADERWSEAVAAGEQIMREFPNSRMAHEVREKMDALRARAANG